VLALANRFHAHADSMEVSGDLEATALSMASVAVGIRSVICIKDLVEISLVAKEGSEEIKDLEETVAETHLEAALVETEEETRLEDLEETEEEIHLEALAVMAVEVVSRSGKSRNTVS